MQRTQNINENNDVSGVHVNRFDSSESVDDSDVVRGVGERRIRTFTGIDLLDRMLDSLQVSDINWINSLKKSFLFLLFISIPLLFVLNPIQREVVPSVSGLESNVGTYFHEKFEYLRNLGREVKNRALNFFRENKDKVRDKVDQVEDKMDRMKTRAKEFMEDKKDYLNEKKDQIKEDVHDAKERTKDYLRDKKDRVKDRFDDSERRSRDREEKEDKEERWGSRDQSRERDDQDRTTRYKQREDSTESDRVRDLERGISRDTRDVRDDDWKKEDSGDGHLENHYPDDYMPSDRFADSGSDIRADVSRPPIRDMRQYAREHHVDLGEYDPNYVEDEVQDKPPQRYRSDQRDRSDRSSQDYRDDERDWERRSRDRVRDSRDRMRDDFEGDVPKAVHRVRETKDQVVDKVIEGVENAKDYLKEKKDQVVDKLGDAKDYLKEKKDEVVDFIKEEAPEVKEYLKEKKDQVVDKLGDAKDYIKEKKDQVVDYFEEEKEEVKSYAKDKKDQVVDKLGDTAKRTKDYVRNKKDQAVDYVDEKTNDSTNQRRRTDSRSRQVQEEEKHYESSYRYDSHKDTYVDKNNKERQSQYESKNINTKKDDTRSTNVDDNNLEGLVTKTSAAVVFKKPFTSPTYARFTFKTFFVNVLSHVIGSKDVLNFPANALSDNMKVGHCFSFEGSRGNITIDLKSPVTVKAVSIEHPQTGHLESSPKRFSVFAYNARSLDQLVHYRNSGSEIGSNLNFPKGHVGPKIFPVTERETRFLQFRFLENNGDPEYTCVYRINVLVDRS